MTSTSISIMLPAIVTFIVGIFSAPILTNFLYKKQMWKKTSVAKTIDGKQATITNSLHNDESRRVPRLGGILVWGSVIIVALVLYVIGDISGDQSISLISRGQTWLPLATLLGGGLIGMIDDIFVCRGEGSYAGGGLSLRTRILAVCFIALGASIWFFVKLDISSIFVPFVGNFDIGIFFIPVFIACIVGLYSGGIIDGIDGLAGGVFAVMFSSYALITFFEGQYDLSALAMAITGGILAFLWFNIPPARFFLGETGTMALTLTLGIIAFLSGHVVELLIIALPLIVTTMSVILQIGSKKLRGGKKIFIVSPLHNHFQALGWPPYKVTMRYWVFSLMCGCFGVIISLVG